MHIRRRSVAGFWAVQALFVLGFGLAAARGTVPDRYFAGLPLRDGPLPDVVTVTHDAPFRIEPLYDAPDLISDAELASVLRQVQPRFDHLKTKPNFVEHALRIWGVDATFGDPAIMSGAQMKDFLLDNSRYVASWGAEMMPLLHDEPGGVSVRWGKADGASVHHDHLLACLSEAGLPLHEPVFTPSRRTRTFNDALQQALRDVHLDEAEIEWTALAFGLWLPPVKSWTNAEGRELSFDRIAERLMRGHKRFGVCYGTHRVYSLMALVRLDDEHHILSPEVRTAAMQHLHTIRQLIIDSQFADGHWPTNWMDGKAAVEKPVNDAIERKVICTGHHLEWLAIAPQELHPPREQIERAMRWCIDTTTAQTPEAILKHYTFYSHVGGAAALWRKTRAADFWRTWEQQHPEAAQPRPKAKFSDIVAPPPAAQTKTPVSAGVDRQ